MDTLFLATVVKREIIRTIAWVLDTEGMMHKEDHTMMAWKVLRTPWIVYFGTACWVAYQLSFARSMVQGRLPFGLHRWFLYYCVVCLMVNVDVFFNTMVVWFSESKLLRCATAALDMESPLRSQLCWAFCAVKSAHLINFAFRVLRNGRGYGRILVMFHCVMKPAVAWLCLKYWITTSNVPIVVFTSGLEALVFLYYLADYYFDEDHPYGWAKNRLQLAVCLLECAQAFLILSFGVHSFYEHYRYNIAFLLWVCGFGLSTLILLLITFRQMLHREMAYKPTCLQCALGLHHTICEALK